MSSPVEPWLLPGALDVQPAESSGGLVAPSGTLRCLEVPAPEVLVEDDPLLRAWVAARDRHRDRLATAVGSFNGDLPLVCDLDPSEGSISWYRSDYASHLASLEMARSVGVSGRGMDFAPSVLVLVACSEGWVRSRRSAKVALPHHWQHAAAEMFDLSDVGDVLDPRQAALRALDEEFALGVPLDSLHPWLVQRQGDPGRGARFVFYVVADLRELTLGDVRSAQRRASDAWEIDEVCAASLPGDWEGLRTLPRLLLPCHDPDAWFLRRVAADR